MNSPSEPRRRMVFVANCVYGDHVAGGDIHFFQMALAASTAGHPLHFFGGQALKGHLAQQPFPCGQSLTDTHKLAPVNMNTLGGQGRLWLNYLGKFLRTLRQRRQIESSDLAYAVTDYWFDAWPVIFSRAQRKIMILGMDAPTLSEIIARSRPDVPPLRLNSIYYWLSQALSLRLFRFCRRKKILYVHPDMKARLLALGYRAEEMVYVSNGFNLETARQVPEQEKRYDAMWIGRVHQQKGLDDLLDTLRHLATELKDFRAVLVGRLDELVPRLQALDLLKHVDLPGLVSESEKFRLFKASRVMLMPSRYESWGIVIAEALASRTPVVAYELKPYPPIFGQLVHYVPPFDSAGFKKAAREEIEKSRAGQTGLNPQELERFMEENSWTAAGRRFMTAAQDLESAPPG